MATHATESRAARTAASESLFREVNERVEEINSASGAGMPREFVCECPDLRCTERIAMTLREYEELREHPDRFAIAPSNAHFLEEAERIAERHERYWIVEKTGLAGSRARELDNRA
jgi:hypothetical protein